MRDLNYKDMGSEIFKILDIPQILTNSFQIYVALDTKYPMLLIYTSSFPTVLI